MPLLAWHQGKVAQETYDMISYIFEPRVPKLYTVHSHSRLIPLIPHHLYVLFNLFNVDVHSSIFLYPILHCAMIKNNSLRLQLSIKINH